MRRPPSRPSVLLGALLAAAALALLACLVGCGTKIAVPRPRGEAGLNTYWTNDVYPAAGAVQLAVIQNNLFVLTAGEGRLTKRDQNFNEIAVVADFDQPTAFCADDEGEFVFVWDQATRTVSTFRSSDLGWVGATSLDTLNRRVRSCVAMAACATGIELEQSGRTFLYLADPDSGVIHRYVYYTAGDLEPFGLLTRSDGDGARFVHQPAGMARDSAGMLLVCDADSSRNWVIRFDPTPDFTDTTPDTSDQDPWRGKATLFADSSCEPPAAADFTLGDAAECGESGWSGGPSAADGEFYLPVSVALDGAGKIYVADRGNDRFQVFDAGGHHQLTFGWEGVTPDPQSIGVVDVRVGSGADDVNFGAFLYLVSSDGQEVRKFISAEHADHINLPPPEPN